MNIKKVSDGSVIDFRPLFKFYEGSSDFQSKTTSKKQKFGVYQFDHETFVVFNRINQREICVCSNYDDLKDAKQRANKIATLLNSNEG